MSSYRGQVGQPTSYRERRGRPGLGRDGQHSGYALIFVAVLLVLVVGLAWALGGFGGGGGSSQPTPRPTPLIVAAATATAPLLPTPPPGTGLPSPVAQPINSPSPTPATGARRTYVVKPGDTPNSIAQQFGVTAADLMQANNISDPRALRIGQELTIPNR
jgi:LysM repeat protein